MSAMLASAASKACRSGAVSGSAAASRSATRQCTEHEPTDRHHGHDHEILLYSWTK
jgi:hypothetical protein